MLSCFHLILERYGRTDRQADRFAISISRVSMLTRVKNGGGIVRGNCPDPVSTAAGPDATAAVTSAFVLSTGEQTGLLQRNTWPGCPKQ